MKKKLNISIVTLSLFCLSLFSFNQSNAQDLAEIADAVVKVGTAIDSSCDEKRPEGGFTACKGGECAPAKCISFRSRCDEEGKCS
jgi:hypothetical protein